MRTIAKAFGLISLGTLGSMDAQVVETNDPAEVQENPDDSRTGTDVKTVTLVP